MEFLNLEAIHTECTRRR